MVVLAVDRAATVTKNELVNFEHVFVNWEQDKIHKTIKCTLNNRTVSLKHVHVAWVSQHGLNNP